MIQPAGTRSVWRMWIVLAAGGLVAAAGVVLALHWFRPQVEVGGPAGQPRRSLDQVEHAAYDRLLQQYVDDEGLVAYARWKATPADLRALDDYLAGLGAVDLSAAASEPARLAFWINAYNALTLKGILAVYPTRSIRQHTPLLGGYNIWRDLRLWVDGQRWSLDDIEHGILRPRGEPRIHFALVCASRGCPPLRNRAYTAESLEADLADNTRRFFARPANFRADPPLQTVYVSELLSPRWYGQDFAPTPAEVIRRLRPYFPNAGQLAWLDEPDVVVGFLEYDWSLNDQAPLAPR